VKGVVLCIKLSTKRNGFYLESSMASKISKNDGERIFDLFQKEWHLQDMNWDYFINNKNLGVQYVPNEENVITNCYIVVDVKKWLLNKLKYGISRY
jgi:hypothetical protein